MRSFSSTNKSFRYLLCVIEVLTEYAWIKDKKVKTVPNAFIERVIKSSRKPNKLQVDQESKIYNKIMQEWLDKNSILIYFTQNKGKSVIAESL